MFKLRQLRKRKSHCQFPLRKWGPSSSAIQFLKVTIPAVAQEILFMRNENGLPGPSWNASNYIMLQFSHVSSTFVHGKKYHETFRDLSIVQQTKSIQEKINIYEYINEQKILAIQKAGISSSPFYEGGKYPSTYQLSKNTIKYTL